MTCPQIYLGTGRTGTPPLPPLYSNDAIGVSGSPLLVGTPQVIGLTVQNHGTQAAPATTLELYWSDPTTGFQAQPARMIGSFGFDSIDPASLSPAMDGLASTNIGWTPDTVALGTNGGHVCLLALVYNTVAPSGAGCMQQLNDSASPATDPLSAIHNVQIVSTSPAPPGPKPPFPRRRWPMWFAFAATNTLRVEDTKLHVRALDPVHDRQKLESLVAQPSIDAALRAQHLKFALPNGVEFVEGRERVVAPIGKVTEHQCIPRISRLGALTPALAERHALPGARLIEAARGPVDVKLLPGEQRQMLVRVDPSDHEHVVYAIEVDHTSAEGHPIGGLTMLFIPPHDYF